MKNPTYKIGKMKDLADRLKLRSNKSFSNLESYLEYAINQINSNVSGWKFYQFFQLADSFLVVLIKDEVEEEVKKPSRPISQKPREQVPESKLDQEISGVEEKLESSEIDFVESEMDEIKLPWGNKSKLNFKE